MSSSRSSGARANYALYAFEEALSWGQAQQEDDMKIKKSFTWDLAATSQSPTLAIFGTLGAWGVKTAEEDSNAVR